MVEEEVFVGIVGILIEMIDSLSIEKGRSSFDSMYFVSFREKELREIGSVLSGDSCYKSFFHKVFVKNISL